MTFVRRVVAPATSIRPLAAGLGAAISVLLAFFLLASGSSAVAATHTGQTTDPTGDGPDPGRDLNGSTVRYDRATGALRFTIELAGEPAPAGATRYIGGLGHRNAQGDCAAPLFMLAAELPDGPTIWMRDDGEPGAASLKAATTRRSSGATVSAASQGNANRSISGRTITLSVPENAAFKDGSPGCAIAIVSDDSGILDDAAVFPVKPVPRAGLRVRLAGAKAVRPGRSVRVKVRVTNPGNIATRKVRVKLGMKGAATIRPRARKIGRLRPGTARTFRVRVKAGRKARGKLRLKARANAGNAPGTAIAWPIKVKMPPKKAPPASGGLSGRLFWNLESGAYDRSARVLGLYFSNSRFAHLGMPEHGLPNCGRATAKRKNGILSAGCVRYSFNSRTGKVRLAGAAGKLKGRTLRLKIRGWGTIANNSWVEAAVPAKGARFKVKLINQGYTGLCGVTPYCITWKEGLQLDRKGRFGWQKSVTASGGGPGSGFVAIHKLGPDERGRYRVLPRGRIKLSYADGTTKTLTIAVQRNGRGKPDPAGSGLLVGTAEFYRDTD